MPARTAVPRSAAVPWRPLPCSARSRARGRWARNVTVRIAQSIASRDLRPAHTIDARSMIVRRPPCRGCSSTTARSNGENVGGVAAQRQRGHVRPELRCDLGTAIADALEAFELEQHRRGPRAARTSPPIDQRAHHSDCAMSPSCHRRRTTIGSSPETSRSASRLMSSDLAPPAVSCVRVTRPCWLDATPILIWRSSVGLCASHARSNGNAGHSTFRFVSTLEHAPYRNDVHHEAGRAEGPVRSSASEDFAGERVAAQEVLGVEHER